MSAVYECKRCGATAPLTEAHWRCPQCEGPMLVSAGQGLTRQQIRTEIGSLWRYGAAIRVPGPLVTLGEGWTPLVPGTVESVPVQFKLEFLMPTGSFKDRGTAVMINHLIDRRIPRVVEDSSGNAGASIAHYAAAAGIGCTIMVPATAPRAKIIQIAASGATVDRVPGSRQAVADKAIAASGSIFYTSHNWQAFFIEGTKTLAFELWEQLGFRVPDNIVVPVGYGSNVLGCAAGFAELAAAGEIDRAPRMFAVQAENCAPFVAAWRAGGDTLPAFPIKPTVADGIASQKPIRLKEVLTAIRESKGAVVGVPEEAIAGALTTLSHRGLFVEPTSATALAALQRLIADGTITRDQTTVVVLTGSGLKAAPVIGDLMGIDG
ncbi:MAG: pyridoxal-phosphate dependent enzyme [Alphaproteobacteria bacterium]|nr:pyridoxal-phosphate dependent enzyme [Alphaproteobacteria bacterium]